MDCGFTRIVLDVCGYILLHERIFSDAEKDSCISLVDASNWHDDKPIVTHKPSGFSADHRLPSMCSSASQGESGREFCAPLTDRPY